MTNFTNHTDLDGMAQAIMRLRQQEDDAIDKRRRADDAHRFQNALRILYNLDEVSDVIGLDAAAEFHRHPPHSIMRMDEPTWLRVYELIEKRQRKVSR